MIPALIRKMIESPDEVVLWGDGSPTREYLYVDDCVDGLVAAAERYDGPEPVNLGTGVETSIRETAELVAEAVGFDGPITWDTSMPNGQPRRSLDASRARELFGWTAQDAAARGDRARRSRRSAPPSREQQRGARRPVTGPASRSRRSAERPTRRRGTSSSRSATIIVVQIGATIALFFSINHNGWLTYQGGDQIWLVTSGWLLGEGIVGYALTSHGWPMLLAPLTWITGSSSVQLLPLTTILQVGVLGPIATLAVYDIGARLAGRLAGLWCACAFVAAPFVAIPYFVQRYHDSWVDQFLPAGARAHAAGGLPVGRRRARLGALTVRALKAGAHREARARRDVRGRRARAQALRTRSSSAARRSPSCSRGASAMPRSSPSALVPALVALTIWKAKGLGEVPLFAQDELRLAAGAADPVVGSVTTWFDRTVNLDFDDVEAEHVEPARVHLERARRPVAPARRRARGRAAVASGRRAPPRLAARLRRRQGRRRRRDRRVGQLLAPDHARPARVRPPRRGRPAARADAHAAARGAARAARPAGARACRATVAVVACHRDRPDRRDRPLAAAHVPRPNPTAPPAFVSHEVVVDDIGVPADADVVGLDVRRTAGGNVLTWSDSTTPAPTFYRSTAPRASVPRPRLRAARRRPLRAPRRDARDDA